MRGSSRQARGFTLIELMITVVIVAILASVALPSYREYVLRTNRGAGKGALSDAAARQEQFFANNKIYANTLTALGLASPLYISDTGESATAATAVYQITVAGTATTFTVTATPQNAQTEDTKCAVLTLNHLGLKTASGTAGAATCW